MTTRALWCRECIDQKNALRCASGGWHIAVDRRSIGSQQREREPPTPGAKDYDATAKRIHQRDRRRLAVGGGAYPEEEAQGDQFILGGDIGRWRRLVGRYPPFGAPRGERWMRPADPTPPTGDISAEYKLIALRVLFGVGAVPYCQAASVALVNALGGGIVVLRSEGWWFPFSLLIYLVMFDLQQYAVHRSWRIGALSVDLLLVDALPAP